MLVLALVYAVLEAQLLRMEVGLQLGVLLVLLLNLQLVQRLQFLQGPRLVRIHLLQDLLDALLQLLLLFPHALVLSRPRLHLLTDKGLRLGLSLLHLLHALFLRNRVLDWG